MYIFCTATVRSVSSGCTCACRRSVQNMYGHRTFLDSEQLRRTYYVQAPYIRYPVGVYVRVAVLYRICTHIVHFSFVHLCRSGSRSMVYISCTHPVHIVLVGLAVTILCCVQNAYDDCTSSATRSLTVTHSGAIALFVV